MQEEFKESSVILDKIFLSFIVSGVNLWHAGHVELFSY